MTSENAIPEGLGAPNVLLMGPTGTGKTDVLGTLVEMGIECFYLDLESGLESLIKHFVRRGKPVPKNLHWHKIDPPKRTWKDFQLAADKVIRLDTKSLANAVDPNRWKYDLFVRILETMSDFPDDRTGKKFGAVDTWGPDRALMIDGLTGLGLASMSGVIGGSILRSQQDWGMAMDQVEIFIRMCADQCPCWFVLLAHVEREPEEILGGMKIMPSTLGKKLAPKLAPIFSDVILTVRGAGAEWFWDTANGQADLKTRNLPIAQKQPPGFRAIFETWQKNVKAHEKAMAEAMEGSAPTA